MKKFWTRAGAGLLFFSLLSIGGAPPAVSGNGDVLLRSGAIRPHASAESSTSFATGDSTTAARWVVRFRQPTGAADRAELLNLAAHIDTPLPGRAYLVSLSADRAASLTALPGVDWATPYEPAHKLAPEITAVAASASDPSSPVIVLLHLFQDADPVAVAAQLRAAGLQVEGAGEGRRFHRVVLTMTAAQVEAWRDRFAARNDVFWVGRRYRRTLLNDTSIWVGQSGLNGGQTTPVFDHGIYGEGQVAAVLDTGIDADACQFRDGSLGLPPTNTDGGTVTDPAQRKVLAVDFLWSAEDPADLTDWDTQNHGTHVAGTLAGDNLANPLIHDAWDGMAPGAKLVIQDGGYQVDNCADLPGIGCPVVDLVPLFQQTYDQGARFHSNSWGDNENAPVQNNYTDASEDVDEFMWFHKDFQVLFAAGNSGPGTASVGSPSTAKNCLSVGATLRGGSADSLAGFSSRGPTDDGRIKPDITFPGSSIVSAQNDLNVGTNNCGSRSMSGTSMACPGAAGLSVLARAYYADGFYPSGAGVPADRFDATSALVKATVINSAVSMTNADPIPSNDQGWGRVLLDNTLYFAGDARRLHVDDHQDGFTGPGDPPEEYAVEVVSTGEPLKVTLVWTDYPSTPAAATHLVNDLDLEVEGPNGVLLGNVFSGGASIPGGSADRLNNVEQVLVKAPTVGSWTVRVSAFTVPNGPQPYALVITGDMDVSTGPHPRYRRHSIDDAPPGGNGDGVLDPGETAVVPVTLRNTGGEIAANIGAVLSPALPGALKVYRNTAAWPDLDPGAEAVSLDPHYKITLEPVAVCGDRPPADLAITGDGFSTDSSFTFQVGQDAGDWPSTDTPLAIPKRSTAGVSSVVNVAESFTLAEVDATVDVTHGDIGELRLILRSPAGTEVVLHNRSGAGVVNLQTTYDDLTQPDGPGTMNDFNGENSAGAWTLVAADDVVGKVKPGTLQSWTLHLRATVPYLCTPLTCADPVPPVVEATLYVDKSGADALLSWTGVTGASDYHVWRDTAPAFPGAVFAGETGGGVTFNDVDALATPEPRYYLVRSVNSCNWESD